MVCFCSMIFFDYDYDNDHFCTQRHGDTELFFDYDYDDDYDFIKG